MSFTLERLLRESIHEVSLTHYLCECLEEVNEDHNFTLLDLVDLNIGLSCVDNL